jgi:hypothetical protein
METRLVRRAHGQVEVEDGALEPMGDGLLDPLSDLTAELALGQDHDDAGAPAQRVRTQEDPDAGGEQVAQDGADVLLQLVYGVWNRSSLGMLLKIVMISL